MSNTHFSNGDFSDGDFSDSDFSDGVIQKDGRSIFQACHRQIKIYSKQNLEAQVTFERRHHSNIKKPELKQPQYTWWREMNSRAPDGYVAFVNRPGVVPNISPGQKTFIVSSEN